MPQRTFLCDSDLPVADALVLSRKQALSATKLKQAYGKRHFASR